jgi:hypothetical protein
VIYELGEIAKGHGRSIKHLGYASCPPLVGIQIRESRDNRCFEYNQQAIALLEASKDLTTVFLIARHALYLNGWSTDLGPAETEAGSVLITDANDAHLDLAGRQALYRTAFLQTIDRLVSAGKVIVLVYPIPETGYDIPRTLAKLAIRGEDPAQFTRPVRYFFERNEFVFSLFDSIGEIEHVVRVYPHERLCDANACIVFANGEALYADDDHLSLAGVHYIAGLLEPVFE